MEIREIGANVLSADSLRMRGVGRMQLHDAVRAGEVVAVHRGWYVAAPIWSAWHAEARHAAKSIAVHRSMRGGGTVLSHTSAAVLHGLPLTRVIPARVHVTGPRVSGSLKASASVARHAATTEGQLESVHGMLVTTLARTVADVVGALPLEAAVALADAALRRVSWHGRRGAELDPYDRATAHAWKEEVLRCASLQPGARGSVQGRWVVAFADGRAESPGESVSRLYLHQLGFAPPRLQVRVPHDGGYYELDFGLDDVDLWGEFDGLQKYTDPVVLKGSSTAQAVMREKHREDDIRGRTRRGLIRWDSAHITSVDAFRRRLATFHVWPPGGPGRIPPSFRSLIL